MPPLTSYRPIDLPPDQLARRRRVNLAVLATAAILYIAWIAIALTNAFVPAVPVRQWWLIPAVAVTLVIANIQFYRQSRELRHAKGKQFVLPFPHNLLYIGAFMAITMLAVSLVSVHLPGREVSVFSFAMAVAIPLGLTLFAAANSSFIITPPSCAECRYPLEGLAFPATCPECAHTAPTRADAVTDRQVHQRKLKAAGIACFAFLLIPLSMPPGVPRVVAASLPANAQLALASTEVAAFNELIHRGLTTDEHRRLADALLDIRDTDDTWQSYQQLDWLGQEHAAGRLTPEQSDRFATDGYHFEITTDTTPRVGVPVSITLAGDCPANPLATCQFAYFVGGFDINGTMHPVTLDQAFAAYGLKARGARGYTTPITVYTPAQPGPLTVRTRIIAITFTSNPPVPAITWHDDDTYTITPPPLTTHEFTAQTTLEVQP